MQYAPFIYMFLAKLISFLLQKYFKNLFVFLYNYNYIITTASHDSVQSTNIIHRQFFERTEQGSK